MVLLLFRLFCPIFRYLLTTLIFQYFREIQKTKLVSFVCIPARDVILSLCIPCFLLILKPNARRKGLCSVISTGHLDERH